MKKYRVIILTILITLIHNVAWAKISIDVKIQGVAEPELTNVTKRLATAQANLGKQPTSRDVKTFYEQAPLHIQKALAPFGYFKPFIKSSMQQRGEKYFFTFFVSLGAAVTIHHIDIQITGPGKDLPELITALQKIPIKSGDILLIEKYNQTKKTLMHVVRNQGYLDAQWLTQKLLINRTIYKADVILHLETGPRYYFGPITFSEVPIGTPLLHRLVPFKEGDPFSADKILVLQDNLSSVNYFEHVTVEANPNRKRFHRYVPVNVLLSMKKRKLYTLGLGYGTDTGVRGSVGVNLRYLNSMGHHFEAQANVSQVKNEIYARYLIPGKNPLTDQYSITAAAFNRDTLSANGVAGQLSFAYVFSKNNWQREYAVSELYSKNINQAFPDNIITYSNVVYPSFDWRMLHTNNQIETPSGYRFNFRVLGAVEEVLSSLSFFQMRLNSKAIFPVFKRDRIVIRGSAGYNSTKDEKMPVSLRLFAGGNETIRGYAFESLPNTGVGRYLYVGSLEFQKHIYQQWYGSIFYDAGDVVVDFPSTIKQSIGIGIVRMTPIGTIDVGIAKAIADDQSIRFVFSVGPDL